LAMSKMKVLLAFALLAVASSTKAASTQLQNGLEFKGMCKLCTEAINAVQGFVKGFDREERAMVRKGCNEIPGFGAMCEEFVDMGLNYVERVNPREACREVRACK